MNIIEALDAFIVYLRLHRNASPRTIEQYMTHIIKFTEYLFPECLIDADGKTVDYRKVYLASSDPKIRAEKDAVKRSIRMKCPLDVENINLDDLNGFRLYKADDEVSVKTANAYMITFRSFFKFLKKRGISCIDPTTIDLVREHDRRVTFLSEDEIKILFAGIPRDTIQ